jgi:hypothetical protein
MMGERRHLKLDGLLTLRVDILAHLDYFHSCSNNIDSRADVKGDEADMNP